MFRFKKANLLDFGLVIIYSIAVVLLIIYVEQDYFVIIATILIFIIDKIFIPRRKELIKKENIKEKKQKFFNNLTELCILCIERKSQKDKREEKRDTRIYILLTKLNNSLKIMGNSIISNKRTEGTKFFQTLIIGEKLHIDANVDPANYRVWYADIYITGEHNQNLSKEFPEISLKELGEEYLDGYKKIVKHYKEKFGFIGGVLEGRCHHQY